MKILILSVSLGLLLGLAERPAWGQSNRQETVKAPGHDPSARPPVVAPDVPVDDFDRGTPRRAVAGFLKAAREDDYRRAAEYLDLRSFGLSADKAQTLGAQLARYLKIVLDQKLPIDIALPSQTTYVEKGGGLDFDRARVAEAQVKEWRERHELWRFPQEKIIEIDNTLEYPAGGSNTGAARR